MDITFYELLYDLRHSSVDKPGSKLMAIFTSPEKLGVGEQRLENVVRKVVLAATGGLRPYKNSFRRICCSGDT